MMAQDLAKKVLANQSIIGALLYHKIDAVTRKDKYKNV